MTTNSGEPAQHAEEGAVAAPREGGRGRLLSLTGRLAFRDLKDEMLLSLCLVSAIAAVLARPEVRDGLQKQGVVTTVAGPEAFGALIAGEVKRWGEVSRRIGLKID